MPAPGATTAPAPGTVASAAPAPAAAAPPAPTVTFTELPPLVFRPGPALRLKPLAKHTRILALSPDTKSWVIEADDAALLVTPRRPAGYRFPASIGSALFAPDGRSVAIWSYFGAFGVLDVATGAVRVSRDVSTCAVRFVGQDQIVFHTASKDGNARLWRMSLATGRATPLGGVRDAETCYASLDGTRWLVEGYDKRWFVDGTSGAARALPMLPAPGMGIQGTLSTAGDRVCSGDDAGFRCVRYPDGRVEDVWSKKSSDTYSVYDPSGRRALFKWADDDDVRDAYALVDFQTLEVRQLKNVKWPSGSTFALGYGGALLTIGSSQGLYVYDLERRVKRLAPHSPLFGNFVFPYAPRAVVGGTDEPMDLFFIDAS